MHNTLHRDAFDCQSRVKLKLLCIVHTPVLQCCHICQRWIGKCMRQLLAQPSAQDRQPSRQQLPPAVSVYTSTSKRETKQSQVVGLACSSCINWTRPLFLECRPQIFLSDRRICGCNLHFGTAYNPEALFLWIICTPFSCTATEERQLQLVTCMNQLQLSYNYNCGGGVACQGRLNVASCVM